ncbi:MAG: hypothetical protein ACON42_00265, partial [Flavobacteriaceae bacterium]
FVVVSLNKQRLKLTSSQNGFASLIVSSISTWIRAVIILSFSQRTLQTEHHCSLFAGANIEPFLFPTNLFKPKFLLFF